jgi:hypothetical protein
MKSIYIASRTRHAERWRRLRASGVNILSTWIDEAEPGQSASLRDLAVRCVAEAAAADTTILYAEPGDVLKGALIEAGAALGAGRPVVAVGCSECWSSALTAHPLWSEAANIRDALIIIDRGSKDESHA